MRMTLVSATNDYCPVEKITETETISQTLTDLFEKCHDNRSVRELWCSLHYLHLLHRCSFYLYQTVWETLQPPLTTPKLHYLQHSIWKTFSGIGYTKCIYVLGVDPNLHYLLQHLGRVAGVGLKSTLAWYNLHPEF